MVMLGGRGYQPFFSTVVQKYGVRPTRWQWTARRHDLARLRLVALWSDAMLLYSTLFRPIAVMSFQWKPRLSVRKKIYRRTEGRGNATHDESQSLTMKSSTLKRYHGDASRGPNGKRKLYLSISAFCFSVAHPSSAPAQEKNSGLAPSSIHRHGWDKSTVHDRLRLSGHPRSKSIRVYPAAGSPCHRRLELLPTATSKSSISRSRSSTRRDRHETPLILRPSLSPNNTWYPADVSRKCMDGTATSSSWPAAQWRPT